MKEHAYEPLLWSYGDPADDERTVEVHPVPLNPDEKRVVDRLRRLAEEEDSVLGDRELFLIRNRSRGRGVSFFDNFGYYPDFIVWLRSGETQHVLFIDPKGLGRYGRREREKIALHRPDQGDRGAASGTTRRDETRSSSSTRTSFRRPRQSRLMKGGFRRPIGDETVCIS